jgi:hypothetical protein
MVFVERKCGVGFGLAPVVGRREANMVKGILTGFAAAS